MNCVYYLQIYIKNVEDIPSKDHRYCLKKYVREERTKPQDYRTDLDITNELDAY